MRRIVKLLLAALVCTFIQSSAHSQDDVSAALKSAIERDSAMNDLEWRSLNLRKRNEAIDPKKVKRQTLTFTFLSLRVPETINNNMTGELELFKSATPTGILDEIERNKERYTFVRADRINEIDFKIVKDEAVGTFSFLVPDLYKGRIGYRARMVDSKWSITEFILPSYEIHLVRDGDSWMTKK